MDFLKKRIQSVVEYSGTGRWIYTTRILAWAFDHEIVAQLPLGIRLFCRYVRVYSRVVGTRTIIFGHGIYRLLRNLGNPREHEPTRLIIDGQQVWLDLSDPGSLWAIQELSTGSTLSSLIAQLARDADLFVDVGANQGIFSAIASRTMQADARIVAIEPQPMLADCVEHTLQASRVKNWKVLRTAVSDRTGMSKLIVPEENQGQAHLSTTASFAGTMITTAVTTLDKLLVYTDAGQVVMKMDIEGAELAALRGGREFLGRHKPTLVMELNPTAMARCGYTINDMAQELGRLGYLYWSPCDCPERTLTLDSLPHGHCDVVLYATRSNR